jgi:hypothetical protein
MYTLLDHPIALFVVSCVFFWGATRLGAALQVKRGPLDASGRGDFDIVLGATLTLLSLLVGFTFSMASSRYDQRKNFEEDEANAIGTAYARADLLASADAIKVHQLLRDYNALRIRFYTTSDTAQVRALNVATLRTQSQMWEAVSAAARASPTPVLALSAATSMNDAINSQGFAQAAAWNRIPMGAWVLLYALGAVATAMIGYRFRLGARHYMLMLILPGIMSTALFLIADIDCSTHGVIRIMPENLLALAPTLD